MEERRRSPRHQVGGEFANLPANMSVRVIDISSAGVLLQSARMLNPGSRAACASRSQAPPLRRTFRCNGFPRRLRPGRVIASGLRLWG